MDANAALVDTPIGSVGLAWRGRTLLRVALPEDAPGTTLARLCERAGAAGVAAPPPWVRALGARIARHLGGEHDDLCDVPLADDDVPAFHRRVYAALRAVPIGRTVSYMELAARAGSPGAARAVGTAMRGNPWPIVVPCHRVLAAQGRPGGFSAHGGLATKESLLAAEGVSLGPPRSLFAPDGALGADVPGRLDALRADPALARLMDRIGPPTLTRTEMASPFEALARAIVYQQLSGKAAATILGRVEALFPRRRLTPEGLATMDDASLRAAGLSRGKTAAMRDLARHTLGGTVPTKAALARLGDEEIVERLTVVRGIGRWTVQMLLMFRLGRPDILPIDDFGVRKGYAIAFGGAMPTPKELAEHGRRWRPNRTLASWYLWRATDSL